MTTTPRSTTELSVSDPQALPRGYQEGLRTGKADRMVQALLDQLPEGEGRELVVAQQMAKHLIEHRRQNVAVLGSHEAFVRHGPDGDLRQVIRAVHLSIAAGDLYQIPKTSWVDPKTGEETTIDAYKAKHGDRAWPEKRVVPATPGQAVLEVQGYRRLNAVAGCLCIEPPMINVDGVERSNPYVQRGPRPPQGGLGDIEEVVVCRVVVGPLPDTGSPWAVRYTLRYDPRTDLHAILAGVAGGKDASQACVLGTAEGVKPGWGFVPLFGGMGYLVNYANKDIVRAYGTFGNLLANALKKALTVCERNALRAHPALGPHARLQVDPAGRAVVAMVGWASDQTALRGFLDLARRAAEGEDLSNGTSVEDRYEAEVTGSAEVVTGEDRPSAPIDAEDAGEVELDERAQLMAGIDQALGALTPAQVEELDYHPADATLDELRAIAFRIDQLLG